MYIYKQLYKIIYHYKTIQNIYPLNTTMDRPLRVITTQKKLSSSYMNNQCAYTHVCITYIGMFIKYVYNMKHTVYIFIL